MIDIPQPPKWTLEIDERERDAQLVKLIRKCERFKVTISRLAAGDYVVNGTVVVERKTVGDFALSVIDGRLFKQAAALTRTGLRPLVVIEGERESATVSLHPHACTGALLSIAVAWRLPVVWSRDPAESLLIFKLLAGQSTAPPCEGVRRGGYRPRRLHSRRVYILEGLPGIGPVLARRLLSAFGSVERVITAEQAALAAVPGLGPRKAAVIRKSVS